MRFIYLCLMFLSFISFYHRKNLTKNNKEGRNLFFFENITPAEGLLLLGALTAENLKKKFHKVKINAADIIDEIINAFNHHDKKFKFGASKNLEKKWANDEEFQQKFLKNWEENKEIKVNIRRLNPITLLKNSISSKNKKLSVIKRKLKLLEKILIPKRNLFVNLKIPNNFNKRRLNSKNSLLDNLLDSLAKTVDSKYV